jgi:hypothetical protein
MPPVWLVWGFWLEGVVSVRHSTISSGGPLFNKESVEELDVTLLDSVVASPKVFENTTAVVADRNLYAIDCQFEEPNGGTVHTTLAAWQAATGNDLDSAAPSDPLLAEDIVTAGNFSLDPASPAFDGGRDAAARKWITPPNIDALTARWSQGIYAHPFDEVGGAEMVVRGRQS